MGFAEEEIRHYVHRTCKLLPQEVRKVRVINKKTFISIPENRLQDCLNAMREAPITKKPYKIYLVEDIRPDGRERRHQGSRFHRDRNERRMGRRHRGRR